MIKFFSTFILFIFLILLSIQEANAGGGPGPVRLYQDVDSKYWKSYVNDKYNYSFKYPQEWELDLEEDYLTYINTESDMEIAIGLSFDNFNTSRFDNYDPEVSLTHYIISGLPTYTEYYGNDYYKDVRINVRENGYGYSIRYDNNYDSENFDYEEALFDEFVKNFKIDAVTKDWNNYSDMGINFKYPKSYKLIENDEQITLESTSNNNDYIKIEIDKKTFPANETSLYGYSEDFFDISSSPNYNFHIGNINGGTKGAYGVLGGFNSKQDNNIVFVYFGNTVFHITKTPIDNRIEEFRQIISSIEIDEELISYSSSSKLVNIPTNKILNVLSRIKENVYFELLNWKFI